MGREGVRELVSDGEIATPEQLAERRARLDEPRDRMPRSDPSRAARRARSTTRPSYGTRFGRPSPSARRPSTRTDKRKRPLPVATRRPGLPEPMPMRQGPRFERIGTDLAERFTAWVADGGEGTEPAATRPAPLRLATSHCNRAP